MSQSAPPPALELTDVTSGYGQLTILHEVSLTVPRHAITALIGCNGAGKSTLLKTVSGIIPIKRGEIRLSGKSLETFPAVYRAYEGIAHVPEGRRIFPRLTVEENLLAGLVAFPTLNRKERVEEVTDPFPILRERLRQLGGTLSGGEQQMLAIARALISAPQMLLLDEPSMGIAPKIVATIFERLKDLTSRGVTILLVEQNAHAALDLAEQAYVIESGRITASGSGAALKGDARVREAYLGGT